MTRALGFAALAALACAAAGRAAEPAQALRVPGGDPFIYLENGTYYLYASHDTDRGITVRTSTDLVRWKDNQGLDAGGYAYRKGNGFGANRFWAPEMYCRKGRYYLFHSAEERVTVDVADSPLGPFRNAEKKPYFAHGGIDNSLFVDDDGRAYMLYAHFNRGNEVWICELEDDLLHAKEGTLRKILRAEEPWEMCAEAPEESIAEGPCLVKAGGLYWLTYSTHNVKYPSYNVCLATAKRLEGPWTKQGAGPILAPRGDLVRTGHHSLFRDRSGKWKMVFHASDKGERRFIRYVYTADVSFTEKDGHPWIDVGEFQPCYLAD